MKTIQIPNQSKINDLFSRNSIKYAAIFGSRAKGMAQNTSDYDFLIEFDSSVKYSLSDLVYLKREIEKNVNAEVDLVTTKGVNPKMESEIKKTARVIYERK